MTPKRFFVKTSPRWRVPAAALLLAFGLGSAATAGSRDRFYEPAAPDPGAVQEVPQDTNAAPLRTTHRIHRAKPKQTDAIVDAPAPQATFFVAVVGDNLASVLAQGLKEALADRPEIGIVRDTKDSSGLVRTDYFDWSKGVHDLLSGTNRIDFAVMLVGSNDAQALYDGATANPIPSDAWKATYTKRVDDIANQFKDKHIPLVWIGVPVMRSDKLSTDLAYINDIYRDEAEKSGATYVDSWGAFVNDQNQFDEFGPDIAGQQVRLRTGDGVHFTRAGQRKLAMFAETPVRQAFDHATPPVDLNALAKTEDSGANALPPEPTVDINTLIQREVGQSAPIPSIGLPPDERQLAPASKTVIQASLPPAAPLRVAPIERPLAGPIIPLTVAPVSAGGALATRTQSNGMASGTDSAILEQTLVEGRQPDAKPGRADDFSWPRP